MTKSSPHSNIASTLAQTGPEGQHRESQRPKLRCPACSFMTQLPATHCSHCGADLRTGLVPPGENSAYEAGPGRKIFVGGLAFILILGLAALFFLFQGAEPPLAAVRPVPATPKSDIEGALDTMQSLSEQPVSGLRPDKIMNRTRAVAGQAENRADLTENSLDNNQ